MFVDLYEKKKTWWLIVKFSDGIDIGVETSVTKVSKFDKLRGNLLCLRCEVDVDIPNNGMNWENIAYVTGLIQGNLRKR